MYPIAGAFFWIVFGSVVGLLAGKVAGAEGPNRTMANLGVATTSAVLAGGIVSLSYSGNQSMTGFVVANVVAVVAAVIAVSLFRLAFHGKSATIR